MCSASQGARAAKTAVSSGNGSSGSSSSSIVSHTWTLPSLRWVTGKEPQQSALALNHNSVSDGIRGRNSNPDKDPAESGTDENMTGHFSEAKASGRGLRHHRGELHQDSRKLPRCRAMMSALCHHGDVAPEPPEGSALVPEKTVFNKSFISQVPLRLQIKVSGQRGSLGISIAGGKGSLPYKEQDEGIFISRVSKGGPAERAGVHVGDRVLEVNGLDMQEVTHHEAVSTLRNAGSCIKMKVLRSRALPHEPCPPPENPVAARETELRIVRQHDPGNSSGGGGGGSNRHVPKQPKVEPPATDYNLSKRIEAVVVCNGNGVNRLNTEPARGRVVKDADASLKSNALQVVKNTMTIPRIILTHPSTSDEDVEPLTPSPDEGDLDDFDDPDSHLSSDCLSSAFYPP
ncbi:tyrosine-protein phosphatase non-receptor type 13 [Alosa alosa]|uniref:tyrosine-protein phosphatase non-receptor type 13 n=1 Tax=Alosa alosa TaxID=278164 RepID=UPI002015275F|nr:tyrosine-protein phosphatase non-receptor type 13 [Alosa alosa]